MRRGLLLLFRDDEGQDLVEYALLTAFFGLCAIVAWTGLRDAIDASYRGATSVQWDPDPPTPPSGP